MKKDRFWLRFDGGPWSEVDKETFVRHERFHGFRNTMGQPNEPATSSFTANKNGVEVQGITRYLDDHETPDLPK